MIQIELKEITKVYDKKIKAVDNVSFSVDGNEFVVLVGPSGCGKTTILRMIAGLEEVTSGKIIIDGKIINKVPPKDRDIAMVFQNYALYPHLSVYENMAFGLKLRKYNKKYIDEQINEAAEILEIEELLTRRPQQLSGGQKQRVALGRAIVRKPKLFLFDEPLSNLDAKLRTMMRTELAHLHKKLKTPMIYVTHDQVEAMTLGENIIILKDGKLQQIGKPVEVYQKPVNQFVASFFGSLPMNLIDGIIKKEETGYLFKSRDESITIRFEENKYNCLKELVEKSVALGIRPEDIKICEEDSSISFNASVNLVENLGSDMIIYFELDKIKMIARVLTAMKIEQDQKIKISFALSSVHFFDNENN